MAKDKGKKALGCFLLIIVVIITIVVVSQHDKSARKGSLERGRTHVVTRERPRPSNATDTTTVSKNAETNTASDPIKSVDAKPKTAANFTQKLSPIQLQYLVYASVCEESIPSLSLGEEAGTLGRLTGRFRILQILGPSSMIVDCVEGRFDETVYTARVDGISTAGQVDGKIIGFGDDTVFLNHGTWSYATVLGAKRTIYYAQTLDRSMLAWARTHLAEQAASKLAEARQKVKDLKRRIETFKKSNRHIVDYARCTELIRMYEPNPGMEAQLNAEKAKLDGMKAVSQEEIAAYRTQLRKLKQELTAAIKRLSK